MLKLTISMLALVCASFQQAGPPATAHPGAKVLFYDPASGQPGPPLTPAPATELAPVRSRGTQYVGLHYWFENERGTKFVDSQAAGMGAHLRLHLRSNVNAFLTVWMTDATNDSVELTPRTAAGPDGKWPGMEIRTGQEFVVSREFIVSPPDQAAHVLMLLARSQTEQVTSASGCREKLQRIAARTLYDGGPALATEIDRSTPGQMGTYIVHRSGAQTGAEVILAR